VFKISPTNFNTKKLCCSDQDALDDPLSVWQRDVPGRLEEEYFIYKFVIFTIINFLLINYFLSQPKIRSMAFLRLLYLKTLGIRIIEAYLEIMLET
jgi:hypothetical protein